MNRRKKKKQDTDYLLLVKERAAQVDWRGLLHSTKSLWMGLPKLHRKLLYVLIPLELLLLVVPMPTFVDVEQPTDQRVPVNVNRVGLSDQLSEANQTPQSKMWHQYTVKSGDTLAEVFRANSLSMADLNALVSIEGSDKPLSQIKAGQLVRYKMNNKGDLDILQLEKGGQSVMFLRMSDGSFGRSH